ncbi:hypothetical protein M0805_006038 [Coniferiporia weirii]|nr:hypothetical protein M0805_006038 [Coniferiporia weirii]
MSISFAEAAALKKAAQQSTKPRIATRPRSMPAAELPRPPPKTMPEPLTFGNVSKPGAFYERPRIKRDLPLVPSPWIGLVAFGIVGLAGWGTFLAYATNQERMSSSVVRQILQNLRESDLVHETLGESVRPEPAWYLNGDPWISGSINMLQGNVDISLRVKGSKGAGTLYFTSIRKDKGQPFTILRFKVICDNGTVLNLPIGLNKQ